MSIEGSRLSNWLRSLCQCVSFALTGLLTHAVYAQGTQGQLPEPIAAARLVHYAEVLELSPQQRQAVENLHAAYRAEFQILREGDIDEWLKLLTTQYNRAYVRNWQRLLERIAVLDDQFLDSAAPILTEQQAGRLPRVNALRKRERAMQVGGAWVWNDARPFDISQTLARSTLSAEERRAIDAILEPYEAALTTHFERAIDDYFAAFEKSLAAYEQAGWTDDRRDDPVNAEGVYAVVKPIWGEWSTRRHAAMKDLVDLNRRTLVSLKPLLPPEVARELHASFIEETYPTRYGMHSMSALVRFPSPYVKALARANLTGEQRAALEAQSAEFHQALSDAIDQAVSKIDQYRDAYAGDFDREDEFEARNVLDRAIGDTLDSLRQRRKTDVERIAALIGPEPVAAAEEIPDPEIADLSKVSHLRMVFGRSELSARLPSAIAANDIATYARWLALDDDQSARLRAAYERYQEQAANLVVEHRPILMASNEALYKGDTVEGWTRENLSRRRQAEASASAAQRAIESAFFREIESISRRAADDPGWQRVWCARERQWLNITAVASSEIRQAGGRCNGLFDLERIILRIPDLDLTSPDVEGILAEHARNIMPLLKARHHALVAWQDADDQLRVEWQELRVATGEQFPDMKSRETEIGIGKLRIAARQAAEPIASLNQATVEHLERVLPVRAAQRVRFTFEKLSWPRIYGDRFSSDAVLAAAMQLADLTLEQRSVVQDVAAEYRPAYDAICEKMKTMVEAPASAIYNQANASQEELIAFRHRCEDRDRIVFERYELSMRARQRLKSVLTDVQAQAIGLGVAMPEPPTNQDQFGT